jgi:8-oxo-dGTP pyrophosphatase MutT (NUDIX family)
MNIAAPRPASTVVLLKPTPARFDVCLVKRHDEVAFMGGACVFPGGALDPADRLDPSDPRCAGLAIAALPGQSHADTIAHYAGAVRELFEEAGIRIDSLDALVPFAHWTTPEIEAKRYDVRFFMAQAPEGQALKADEHETTEAIWLDPSEALDACRRGDILLAPPTWTTLRWLERFRSIGEALAWARQARAGNVSPRLFEENGQRTLALPGDPRYPPVEGFDTPTETRFVFGNGRWTAIEKG